jgi:small subunit ribosomal protein S9
MAEKAEKVDEKADAKVAETVVEKESTEAPKEAPKAEEVAPSRTAPTPPPDKHYFWGTGRRKKAVARVRIRPGSGKIVVNKRDAEAYFHTDKDRTAVLTPLLVAQMVKSWDVWVNVKGGGSTGQADAVKLGLARALAGAVPDVERSLRSQGLLTRDPRMSERKKPGQPGARKKFQFSKR